jgi:hypothetical protein
MNRRRSWAISIASGCGRGSRGAGTTERPRPRSSCGTLAWSARSTRRPGPRRPGWPPRSAIRRRARWSPGPAPPCSPGGWRGPPASRGRFRPARPRGGWRPGRRPAGRWRRPGRWAARCRGSGGRPRCRPRSRCGGCGSRWPRWSSCRRCSTGWTAARRWTRRGTWRPGSWTTPRTAWGFGKDVPNGGPSSPCCPCYAAVTWAAVSYPGALPALVPAYLCRPRLNSAGTMTSSGVSSPMEDRPSASRVESMPPRSTSKTFLTPAEPLAASPHR